MKRDFLVIAIMWAVAIFVATDIEAQVRQATCNLEARAFRGYTFIHPPIIHKKAAYAPFFLDFGQMYDPYFNADHQRDDNIAEWNERFCSQADSIEIDYVVYRSTVAELSILLRAANDVNRKTSLPTSFSGNSFAEVLAYNRCSEAIEYLIFAKRCEPHVAPKQAWLVEERDINAMNVLIDEGLRRFEHCRSNFFKQRYAFQIVRLAHYSRQWQRTVELYNYLLPKIDRRRSSIIFYWTLGHLAGALHQLGKDAEAAYRFSLIFRNCPSKRISAWRSFFIPNDKVWTETLRLCQNDGERATLYALRAARARTETIEELTKIYELDPAHPALDLMLVSNVQYFEKMLLRTPNTDKKYGLTEAAKRQKTGQLRLPVLLQFVRKATLEGKIPNPNLWRLIEGYLLQLANQTQAAEYVFNEMEKILKTSEKAENSAALLRQIEVWRTLQMILKLDALQTNVDDEAYRLRSLKIVQEYPSFLPFLQDWLVARYAESERPGKAILSAYNLNAFALNPNLKALDDLINTAQAPQKSGIEYEMTGDSSAEKFLAKVLEIKAVYLFSLGQPEAALATLREIPPAQAVDLPKFSPFKLYINDCLNCPVAAPQYLTRRQIIERLGELEFNAKAAAATGEPQRAAENYFLLGLAYFNTSWFGYEWETFDFQRDPQNWYRLSAGPVFPLTGTPAGNRENLDVTRALSFFERTLHYSRHDELSAKAAFMAAKCQQKQWFCHPQCKYRPGSHRLPLLPEEFRTYYRLMKTKYSHTNFYSEVVRECKWFLAYTR